MGARATALLTAALLTFSPGCGLLLFSTHQPVEITTHIDGAEIYLDGKLQDELTPGTISVSRKGTHRVDVKLGDQSGGTTLTQTLMIPVGLMDFCTLGIGLLIDYITGTLYEFPLSVRVPLGKAPPPSVGTTPTGVTPPTPSADAEPCALCGEPRGDATPCPHCGIE